MIEKLQPFVQQTIAHTEEIERDLFVFYNRAGEAIGEYEYFDGLLQRIQLFEAEDAVLEHVAISAEQATSIAKNFIEQVDNRGLVLESLVNFDTHYLAIFEEVDERYHLPLPNTGAHVSLDAEGYLITAMFFTEPYTVTYPKSCISKEQARAILHEQLLVEKVLDTQNWRYVYGQNHELFGVHVDGSLNHLAQDDTLETLYHDVPLTKIDAPLDVLMINEYQGVVVKEDTSLDGMKHWYIAQTDEDDHYQLDLSSFEDVDDDILDFELEDNHLVELPDTGIYIEDDVLLQRAHELLYVLVGNEMIHYKREESTGLAQILQHSPFFADDFESSDANFRFVYAVDGVYIHDKAIDISIHRSTGVVLEIVQAILPYDVLRRLEQPKLSLSEADAIAQNLADVTLAFMRTNLEENLYELTYLITYPDSPTGGHIDEIDGDTGEVSYVDTGFSPFDE